MSTTTKKKTPVVKAVKAVNKAKRPPVVIGKQTFQTKADAAKFVIREGVKTNLRAKDIHQRLMDDVGLTNAGANTYQYKYKPAIKQELETKQAVNS